MEIKTTVQGYLIYAAIAAHLLAFMVSVVGLKKSGRAIYAVGFALVVIAFGYRWYHVQHVPLQNLFEVFLCMGMFFPLSVFCRRFLRVGAETADMMIGVIVLIPAGFIFSAEPRQLPPALQSWLFAPHVFVYMFSYVLMAKATVQAAAQLFIRNGKPSDPELVSYELGTYRVICLGFPLLTLGLILGSYWGKWAWGDFWGWDPKELWSLVSWLAYLGYLHFRYMHGKKHSNINSILAIIAMVTIVITLLWVNLAKIFAGMHSYAS